MVKLDECLDETHEALLLDKLSWETHREVLANQNLDTSKVDQALAIVDKKIDDYVKLCADMASPDDGEDDSTFDTLRPAIEADFEDFEGVEGTENN